ncbi:L-aminopeptidase/D-esterase-like protein [Rhizobium sp. PP-F2F-G48]|uniref:P1 family peptidase n=1 Tax=Rhizobium sp. PP-F2F-G48 TaxID=2135651 RepID=UPI00104310A5|nr:P1 family peptidase [Rhizobium sp. PP-F2F-G48]TCM58951.1 L-aminopeptidase/D-esterase-like protein [Rhizobium sp. PP-F2F-G48]
MTFRRGPLNALTDVPGLTVGHAQDESLKSGVTAILCDPPAVAAVSIMGGSPGTRETDLLEPHNSVQTVDALCLSGGSAFGLDAASGVQAALRAMGRGLKVGPAIVPIVPAAILFDLNNGGDKNWGTYGPYRDLGFTAAMAATREMATGSVGAGTGAATATLKGGLGTASTVLANGITVGALAAVNPLGSATIGDTACFWAAPFELEGEFGGLGLPMPMPANATAVRTKLDAIAPMANTTIAVIATDVALSKAEAKRLAVAAHDGFSRALWPSHTPLDGDLVFAVSTGRRPGNLDPAAFLDLCAAAASTMARAIARGVHDATPAAGDLRPCWRDLASVST